MTRLFFFLSFLLCATLLSHDNDTVFFGAMGSGGATDHGTLTGLADDDHPQYVLADGTRDITGNLTVNGEVIARKDNATSLRVKGPQHATEGGADVQSYSGIFYNNNYDGTGTLKTRVIHGANIEMDMEVQSPHQLRITAVDDTQADGQVWASSKTDFVFNARADSETASPKRLIIDRQVTGTTGASNTSDVNVKVNSGNLRLNNGVTDGSVVISSLTTAQRDALTPVTGMLIYNSTMNELQEYNGSWETLATETYVDNAVSGKIDAVSSTDNAVVRYDGTSGAVQNSGVTIDDNDNLSVAGQAYSPIDTETVAAGTSHTVNWNDGNTTVLDLQNLTGDLTSLTLSNPQGGAYYCIKVIQSSTARTITWPASVLWPGGSACTLSTTNDAIDLVCGMYDGANYLMSCENDYQ